MKEITITATENETFPYTVLSVHEDCTHEMYCGNKEEVLAEVKRLLGSEE